MEITGERSEMAFLAQRMLPKGLHAGVTDGKEGRCWDESRPTFPLFHGSDRR
jgi:hypothetical protein